MDRRGFLRYLPMLPTLPAVAMQHITPIQKIMTSETTRPTLMKGGLFKTRQSWEVLANGGKRIIEHVTWVTVNNETIPGSTRWIQYARR